MKAMATGSMAMLLIACSSPQEMSDGVGLGDDGAGPTALRSGSELERTTGARVAPVEFKDEEKDGEAARDFTYSWPSEVSFEAPLARLLSDRRRQALAEQKAEWRASVDEFGNGTGEDACFSCVNRSYTMNWAVAADTGRFLSIFAESYVYSGGAHGNTGFDALIWDREAGRGQGAALAPADLFTSLDALEKALRVPSCDTLLLMRATKRGPENFNGVDPLDDCPSLTELTLVVNSTDGEKIDRLGLFAAPYIAGPYAEGDYRIAVPVTEAVLETVKPDYRVAFSLGS